MASRQPSEAEDTSNREPPPAEPGATARVAAVALVVVLFTALVLLTIGVASRWAPLMTFDEAVEQTVHRMAVDHRDTAVPLFGVIADLGSPLAMNLVVLVGAISLFATGRRRAGSYLVAARLLELGVETLLKATVARPRPTWVDPVDTATSTSFPSGHSAGTAVVYLCLLVIGLGAVGWPQSALARAGAAVGIVVGAALLVAVPVSRVVLGVHYPSDVAGGVVLGLVCALALCPLARWRPRSATR